MYKDTISRAARIVNEMATCTEAFEKDPDTFCECMFEHGSVEEEFVDALLHYYSLYEAVKPNIGN